MIFLTVGTQFPFDRLVKAVDKAIEHNGCAVEIFAQIADSSYRPRYFDSVPYLQKDDFDRNMHRASSIISHAGMGTITAALDSKKPMLVMPRLRKYGEVVNDHQVAIAKKFEQMGHLVVAYNEDDISEKIKTLEQFVPTDRKKSVDAVTQRISSFIQQVMHLGEFA
jgi:UDP-N-acetylglucosamine transferase subunit ALG13